MDSSSAANLRWPTSAERITGNPEGGIGWRCPEFGFEDPTPVYGPGLAIRVHESTKVSNLWCCRGHRDYNARAASPPDFTLETGFQREFVASTCGYAIYVSGERLG
jgi:hypothetical protein